MAETGLVARSPIAPPPPVTIEHGWEISARRSDATLRITDCTPLAKVLVRARSDVQVLHVLGVSFGRAGRDPSGTLVVGAGPGEWLLLGPPGSAQTLMRSAAELSDEAWVSIFDETHGRALLRIGGADAGAMLSKVCAIDLADDVTPDGTAFRSSIAGVVTEVVRDDHGGERAYLLGCERASGQYLFDVLLDAGEEFGIDVGGLVFPGI